MLLRSNKIIFMITLLILPLAVIVLSLFIGRYAISIKEVVAVFSNLAGLYDIRVSHETFTVIVYLRLPRAIAAAFIGGGLACSGAAFQGVFRNPLVNSGLLGVSSGAAFGAALSIILFGVTYYIYGFAFLFGIIAVGASYWVAMIYRSVQTIMLILGGIIVSSLFGALLTLLKYLADVNDQLPAIVYWLMGSVAAVDYADFWALIPIVAGITVILFYGWQINVLSMGDKEARTLGVNVKQSRIVIIAAATLCTAGAVCISGTIGWVGLVIPHIGRMLVGNDNRRLLPVSISIGAAFMVAIDALSRSLSTGEIPLGILTAIIGAPFFIFLLKKTKGGGWAGWN